MIHLRYDAKGGRAGTFRVLGRVKSAFEIEAWMRASDVSQVHVVRFLVKPQERGDVRRRIDGRVVLMVGQNDETSWRCESFDWQPYGLPRAVVYLLQCPPDLFR